MTIDDFVRKAGELTGVAVTSVAATATVAYGIEALTGNYITPLAIGLTAVGVGAIQQFRRYIYEEYIPLKPHSPVFDTAVTHGFFAVSAGAVIAALSTVDTIISPMYQEISRSVQDIATYTGFLAGSYATAEGIIAAGKKTIEFGKEIAQKIQESWTPVVALGALALLGGIIAYTLDSEKSGKENDDTDIEDRPTQPEEEQLMEMRAKVGKQKENSVQSFLIADWPVDNPNHIVSSCFGFRGYNVAGGNGTSIHEGIDIRAKKGTPVFSIREGIVESVDQKTWGSVTISAGDGYSFNYLHLHTIAVQKEEFVTQGQVIGTVGGRGPRGIHDYRPHLHLELIDTNLPDSLRDPHGNYTVLRQRGNPLCYMDPSLTYQMVANSGCTSQGGWDKFCEAYHGFSTAPVNTTETILHSIETTYSSIAEEAVKDTSLTPSLLYAVIMTESRGNASAFSPDKRYVGLMGLSSDIAYAYGACDEKCKTDERTNPEQAIQAGAEYLDTIGLPFAGYTAKNELTLVAYNAGPAVAQALAASTGNVAWDEMACELTEPLLAEVHGRTKDSSLSTKAKRVRKIGIVNEYIRDIEGYMEFYEN